MPSSLTKAVLGPPSLAFHALHSSRLTHSLLSSHPSLLSPHAFTPLLTAPRPTQREADEKAALASVRSSLTDADLATLVAETKALKASQAAKNDPADLAKLPVLATADLERASKPLPIEVKPLG